MGYAPGVDGYTTTQLCELAGITYRQADYWARLSVLLPSMHDAKGSGSRRGYNGTDVALARILRDLAASGAVATTMAEVVHVLRTQPDAWDATLLVTGDGTITVTTTPAAALAELGLVACWVINPAAALVPASEQVLA